MISLNSLFVSRFNWPFILATLFYSIYPFYGAQSQNGKIRTSVTTPSDTSHICFTMSCILGVGASKQALVWSLNKLVPSLMRRGDYCVLRGR